MANTPYENYVLENKFEDQFKSYLDLMQFCTIDDSLVETAGMNKTIRTYKATNNKTEALTQGNGNTVSIEVDFYQKTYTVELLQNRFIYFDEEAMKDPLVVDKGLNHQAVDMYNKVNSEIMTTLLSTSFTKDDTGTTITVPSVSNLTKFDFAAFVDGVAKFGDVKIDEADAIKGLGIFAIVSNEDVAEIRKELGDLLKYVEAFARQGYIGTVAGINIYISAIATKGTITLATRKAVTYFVKKGTEVEQQRDANTRRNEAFLRKYGIPALTDVSQIVLLKKGA